MVKALEKQAGENRRVLGRLRGYGQAFGEVVLAMGRWPFDLGKIDVPVDIWYGEQDRSHSPDNGETLAGRIPGARRHLVPGIGGAVLWTEAERILRTSLDAAGMTRT